MLDKIQWKKRIPKLLEILFMIASPFFMFLQVELLEENPLNNIRNSFYLVNYIWYALALGVFLLLFRRKRYALEAGVILTYLLGLVNHYVVEFRGIPILPWDIKSIGTAADVAGGYSYRFSASTWAVTAATVVYLILTHFLVSKKKIKLRDKVTYVFGTAYLVFAGVVWYLHISVGLLGLHGWTVYAWNQLVQYQCCGVAASFMENLRFLNVEAPKDYSIEEIEALAEEYGEETSKESTPPNIIVIMSESFADISLIKDLGEDSDYLSYFYSLTENTIRGQLNVSAFGGNTCNTEFEFLTSLSMAFVPSGSVPYQQYIDRDISSICDILKAQGYSTTAIHPCKAANWNRSKVYPYLGFDEFISEEDFQTNSTSYLRGYMTDAADFDRLILEYEERKKDGPCFLFNVTMQNHGGYSDGTEMYVDLLKKTDKEIERLTTYLQEQPEPTLLLIFGDHQPNLKDGTYDEINQETDMSVYRNKYLVPFLLWANYDIDKADSLDISPNFLAPLLLKTAGLSMPPYYRLLLDKLNTVSALSINGHLTALGEWVEPSQNGKDEVTALLERLQYNKLFDEKGYVKEMFDIK
jgi:phosphoglycerol transferase MdoB-like AlkP superfamily enzyme